MRPEPYPGFKQERAAAAKREQALRQAAADPLPGPLADAFSALPDTIGGRRVRPVVHYDFVVLRALKSPILHQLEQAAQARKASSPFSDDQGYELIYLFTQPAEAVADFFDKHAAAAPARFRKAARKEIGLALGPVEVALLVKAVEKAFLTAFSTVLQFDAKEPGGGDAVFTPPPPATGTGSAGGSTISPA